jgi:glutamate transport system substrate-binding protein
MSSPTPITPEFPGLPGRRPRRRLRAALGAALVATLAVGGALGGPPARPAAAREAARSSPTVAEIRARGEIVVGTKFDQPLFGLRDATTGEVDGFDVEIARLVVREVFGRRVARNIRFVETPSRTREDALTSGAADLVVATYTITPEREAVIDFAGPYYTSGQAILTRKADTAIRGTADLGGRPVCTVSGSTSATNLTTRVPTAVPVLVDTYSECVARLRAGTVDAATTDEAILLGYLATEPGAFRLAGSPFTSEPYGIGIAPGDPALVREVGTALRNAFRDGSWTRAWKRTIGRTGAPVPDPPVTTSRQASRV